MSDHILHITEVTKYGTEYDLECVGHDKKTCNLQTWWFNEWDDLLKLDPIDIPIPVRAEWNNSDEPTIVLAAVDPATAVGVFDIAKHLREAHDTLHQFADRIDEFVWGELDAVLNPDSWDTTAADPAVTITWDGRGKTLAAIREHLPADWVADIGEESTLILSPQGDYDAMSFTEVGENWRIRIEGDSFAILPPKEEQS